MLTMPRPRKLEFIYSVYLKLELGNRGMHIVHDIAMNINTVIKYTHILKKSTKLKHKYNH